MRIIPPIFAILISLCSCVGLLDYPIELGDGFFYLNHMIYFSNDSNGHTIDTIYAENVSACKSDDRFIVSQFISDSTVNSAEMGNNGFTVVTIPDTLYGIIDKHKQNNCGYYHNKDLIKTLDSLNINLNLVDKLIF